MDIADTYDEVAEDHGLEINYLCDGEEPLTFKAIVEDYGLGFVPAGIDERFKRHNSSWCKFSFSANRLAVYPTGKDQIKYGERTFTVRQHHPIIVEGVAQVHEVYASTMPLSTR